MAEPIPAPTRKLPLTTIWMILSVTFMFFYPLYTLGALTGITPFELTITGEFSFVVLILYLAFSRPKVAK